MKKLLFMFLLVATALSCSDDDNATEAVSIVGTWKLTALYNGTTPGPVSDCMRNVVFKLNADNTSQQTVAVDGAGGTCTVDTYDGVYVVSGNTLTISNSLMQPGYEILALSSTKLHVMPLGGDGDVPSIEFTRQ